MSVKEPTKELSVSIQDAAFPKPFYQGLEFNAPVHGSWNIVHIGMLLPEARQIYVCADNCMRGVVLTAAEMKAEERFSFVLLEENDLIMGKLEDVTIDGVSECLEQLDEKPPVVLLFTVCVHHFLGCDLDYIYRKLHERYPDIYFCRCYMDPLLQKSGPTPDQKLRAAMYDPVMLLDTNPETPSISLIGSEFPLYKSSDIYSIIKLVSGIPAANASDTSLNPVLSAFAKAYMCNSAKADCQKNENTIMPDTTCGMKENMSPHMKPCAKRKLRFSDGSEQGIRLRELGSCRTYDEFLKIGESSLFIADQPGAVMALERLSQRLNRPSLYLPKSFDYEEIAGEWIRLSTVLLNILTKEATEDSMQIPRSELSDGRNHFTCNMVSDGKSHLIREEVYDNTCQLFLGRMPNDRNSLLHENIKAEQATCEEAFAELKKLIGDTEIRIDYTCHPRPLGLARQLLAHGFNVTTVYIDVINAEEEADFSFLCKYAPKLRLCSTVQIEARTASRNCPDVLAVGQKAAWFAGTRHFVNIVSGAGLFGYDGIRRILALMAEAYNTENDTEDLVIRKGWGCTSCV